MTTEQTKEAIRIAGGEWDLFVHWMRGQTVGMDEDGNTNWYETDVARFIRNNTPKGKQVDVIIKDVYERI